MNRPPTPYNVRLVSAALESHRLRAPAEMLISEHIREMRARGEEFAPWTPVGESAFLSRRQVLAMANALERHFYPPGDSDSTGLAPVVSRNTAKYPGARDSMATGVRVGRRTSFRGEALRGIGLEPDL